MKIHSMITWCVIVVLSLHTGFAQTSANNKIETITPKSLSITATPQRTWSPTFNSDCGASKRCKRMSLKNFKKEKWINAVAYAASGLDVKISKRNKRKLLTVLTQANYDKAKAAFMAKKSTLEEKTVSYESYKTTTDMFSLHWESFRFAMLNQLIKAIENPTKIALYPVTPDDLEGLRRKLEGYKKRTAQEYYEAGHYYLKQGNTRKDKNDWKRSALHFLIADQYINGFKDALSQYESTKKLATSTVYMSGHYHGHGGFGGTLDEDVKSELIRSTGLPHLRFVEIVNAKNADYHIKLVTSGLELVTRGKTADKQEFSKEVTDANGNKVTKKATVTTYTSGYNARAKVNAEIIDRKTKRVVYATTSQATYEWVTVWQKGTGDLDIVKQRYKRHIGKSPDRAPNRKTLYERAIAMCAKDIAAKVYVNFLRKVGSIPQH